MTDEEKVATVRNVISDLEYTLSRMYGAMQIDDQHESHKEILDLWMDCKLAVEYITHDYPHL